MQTAPLPAMEKQRLEKLHNYEILDTVPERDYDNIVYLVAHICRTPVAYISLIDSDRQWFKAKYGLSEVQTSRDVAFCAHAILERRPLIVHDATKDERFHDNPLVTESPGIRFYAGVPLITPEGYAVGTLCAVDYTPRELSREQRDALEILAQNVVNLLELGVRKRQLEEKNNEIECRNRELGELNALKDRLISILAHDFRAPLNNVDSIVQMVRRKLVRNEELPGMLEELSNVAGAARGLLENILGWIRKSVGNGAQQYAEIVVAKVAERIVEELGDAAHRKGNDIQLLGDRSVALWTDEEALAFVVRNLVSNANKFTENGRITVTWQKRDGDIRLSVSDTGIGFDPQKTPIFDWQNRRNNQGTAGERGSGLGLLFSRDFVARLGGEIAYDSSPGEGSVFTVRLPAGSPAEQKDEENVSGTERA